MANPDDVAQHRLAQADAALQRSPRRRGPHPLPLFLASVTRECGSDRARLAAVLAGLARYQQAADPAPRPLRPLVASVGGVSLRDHGGVALRDHGGVSLRDHGGVALRDHGGDTASHDRLLVMVPSLINPATVLDLAPGNSLLDALAAAGIRPLLVDWGEIPPVDPAPLVRNHLVPLIASLGEPVALAGYCVGGTLALGAAQCLGDRVERLALLATPWHFAGYAEPLRRGFGDWWRAVSPLANQLGGVPIDLIQPAFWAIDPAGLADKFARLADLPDADAVEAFVRLEDWTNTGTTLPRPVARALFEDFFQADITGSGDWRIDGEAIDPAALACPVIDIVAARDRLVPAAAALSAGDASIPRLTIAAGHVGMIVGREAPHQLWAPLAEWLRG